jgi:hypothetical protein
MSTVDMSNGSGDTRDGAERLGTDRLERNGTAGDLILAGC